MNRDELLEVFRTVASEPGRFGDRLAEACARVLVVPGCGVSLILEGEHRGSIGASSDAAAGGEDLQQLHGEGPAFDAARQHEVVSEPHLAEPREGRWLAFSAAAADQGIAAVTAAPLVIGAVVLGALTVYEPKPGELTAAQCRDLVALSEIVGGLVLSLQAGADPGTLAAEVDDVGAYHPEIHQATGMVAAQLAVPVSQAMVRLRARAYADDVPLASLARDVVARRTRFDQP